MINLALLSILLHISKVYLTGCKILQHGANSFTFPPKKDMPRIFITLKKIHHRWPGLNQ
jgi:hypothetical protein